VGKKPHTAPTSSAAADAQGALEGYPGAALRINASGRVVAANAKGLGLKALLERDSVPDVRLLIERAAREAAIAAGTVKLQGGEGEIVLEVAVVPEANGAGAALVLARDLTMERNLRTALVDSRQRYKDLVEVSSDFTRA
jgi:hypothetical protein